MSPHEPLTDRVYRWIARRLPRGLVLACGIRMFEHAVTGRYDGTESVSLRAGRMIERWLDGGR